MLHDVDPGSDTGSTLFAAASEQALRLAQESGDVALGAHVLAGMSDQARMLGYPREALQLATTGRHGLAHVSSPACVADLWALQARAHAVLGDATAAAHAVVESERAFERIEVDIEPEWARFIDGAYLPGEWANTFGDLGRSVESARFARRSISAAAAQNRARRGALSQAALARSALIRQDLSVPAAMSGTRPWTVRRRAMRSTATHRPDALAEVLDRAVEAGILSAEQAGAVLAAERARTERPNAPGRRLPVTEALGYLGGLLVLSGAVTLAAQYWLDLSTAARLALLAAVALATWLVGARIVDPAAPALLRLRGALWFASSMAVAGFAAEFAWDVGQADDVGIAISAGAAGAAHAAGLWRLRDRPAQHLACLAGLLIAAGGVGDLLGDAGAIGLVVGGAGAVWTVAGWYRLLPPPGLALLGGAAAVLFGAGITAGSWPGAAPLLGLAAAGVLAAVGVGTNRTALTVAGLLGAFVYLPWAVGHFFADSLGVPLAMVLCGAALLVVTLLLLRRPPDP